MTDGMHDQDSASLDVGVLTDEISRDLNEALRVAREWGIRRVELREGTEARFPGFTRDEIRWVDEARRSGTVVTAVSPGIFKGHVEDESRTRRELEETLPLALDMAERFECDTLIAFGFQKAPDESASNRTRAMRSFEAAARRAEAHGVCVAVENEPNFWVDRPAETAETLEEIGHPLLRANWDPANTIWGGLDVEKSDFEALSRFIRNVHVKDFDPSDRETPWRPVGRGTIDWEKILGWIVDGTDLEHVTLETHCTPLLENSRESLETLRGIIERAGSGVQRSE